MEGEQLEDRRSVGENSCNSGDGTDQTGPIIDVYDDDDDDDIQNYLMKIHFNIRLQSTSMSVKCFRHFYRFLTTKLHTFLICPIRDICAAYLILTRMYISV